VLHRVGELAEQKFAHTSDVRYTAVSGFIFLRFYAPAILSPHLFGLCRLQPSTGNFFLCTPLPNGKLPQAVFGHLQLMTHLSPVFRCCPNINAPFKDGAGHGQPWP
jgi:hypothetical protein